MVQEPPLQEERKLNSEALSTVPAWPADLFWLRDARLQVSAFSVHGFCKRLSHNTLGSASPEQGL